MSGSLTRLLRPRSIAVIGGKEAERVAWQLQKMGYEGDIWPVHPHRQEVAQLPVFRNVDALPGPPDASFIGVNRTLTVDTVRALSRRGAGGAVCYASGFSEAETETGDGEALQRALLEAAGHMPIVGPNCYGLINYADGALLWPDQHGGQRLPAGSKGVAIITQSSNLAVNLSMQRRGLPLAYLLTAGNQAQIGISAMAGALLEDERITAIGLHIEGVDEVPAFAGLAQRARTLGKPLVVLKVGRSEQARQAALSHTASIAGSEQASRAFFRRHGIAQVRSTEALVESLKLLHVCGPLPGFRIASMSCSGGEASLIADCVDGRRVHFGSLTDEQCAALKRVLGPLVSVANPLDYHTFIWGRREALEDTFTTMLGAGFDFTALLLDFPRLERCDDEDWAVCVDAFEAAMLRTGGRGGIVASLSENIPEEYVPGLMQRGIVALGGIDHALDALEAAADIGEAWSRPYPDVLWPTDTSSASIRTLDEYEAKVRLGAHGVPVPDGERAADADQAARIAARLPSPLAVKALGVAHKSERQALCLGVQGSAEASEAARRMLPLGQGVLVERMAPKPVAELLIGVHHEPPYGLLLTLASGGVLVELIRDSVSLLLPASNQDIHEALSRLAVMRVIRGYRGGAPGDEPAMMEAIHAILAFVQANAPGLVELDINPLLVCEQGQGAWAVDALIRMREETHE